MTFDYGYNRYIVPQPTENEPYSEFESRMEKFLETEQRRIYGMTTQALYREAGIVEVEDE